MSGQENNVIFVNALLYRRALLLPVRHQFIDPPRVHDSAGNDMRSNLFSFFENRNRQVLVQLPQLVGCSEPGRTATDDQDIDFEGVTLGHVLRLTINCGYPSYFLKRRAAFVPPNPKELESA